MDTSDMSEPLAQPLPASPGPSVTGSGIGGPPSVASSTSMLAPTPGAGEYSVFNSTLHEKINMILHRFNYLSPTH